MYYYFYKTTNKVNGRYYLGVHHSVDPKNDTYIGSGFLLKRAIERYGRENFSTEILKYFDTMEEAYSYEREQVTKEVLQDPKCYNLVLGGKGGCNEDIRMNNGVREIKVHFSKEPLMQEQGWVRGNLPRTEETKNKIRISNSKPKTELHRQHLRKPKFGARGKHCMNNGKTEIRVRNEEVEHYQKEGWVLGQLRGVTAWICKEDRNKLVRKDELQKYLEEGWQPGQRKRAWVCSESRISLIPESRLEEYLQKGWQRGKTFKHE